MNSTSAKMNQPDSTLDLFEMWKNIYYTTENSLGKLVKSTISTDSASTNMIQFMNFYLEFEKMFRKGMEQYFESTPLISKKDIARVAKLVIGVEDKVDNLESSLESKLDRLVNNLALMVEKISHEQAERAKKEIELSQISENLESANIRLSILTDQIEGLATQLAASETADNKSSATKRSGGKPSRKRQSETVATE